MAGDEALELELDPGELVTPQVVASLLPDPARVPFLSQMEEGPDATLKSPPSTAIEVLNLTRQDDVNLLELEECLSRDAAVSIALLKVANAANQGPGPRVSRLSDAIVRLGLQEVQGIAIGTSALGSFDVRDKVVRDVVTHGTEVAFVARHLAYERLEVAAEEAFCCGMLHDLGKAMLVQADRDSYLRMLSEAALEPDATHLLERERYGVDHGEVGGWLLQRWDMPPVCAAATTAHHRADRLHEPPVSASLQLLVATIRLADQLTYLLSRHDRAPRADLDRLAAGEAATQLALSRRDLERLWDELIGVLMRAGKIWVFRGI